MFRDAPRPRRGDHGRQADELIPAAVYEPVEAAAGAVVAADIVMGTGSQPLFPGLVLSQYGKGKAAYIPVALEAMYRQTRIRQFADFLRAVVAYVSPDGLQYQIDAPSTLIANMMSRGDTRVLLEYESPALSCLCLRTSHRV